MVWPFGEVIANGTLNYPLWQIVFFELCHGTLSLLAALLVSSPVACWISTTYRNGSSTPITGSRSLFGGRMTLARAVIYMALLSLGAGLCAHTLEDLYFSWF